MTSAGQVPITVVTGFLGSGKTTFINYLLNENHGKKIAIIENEFGEVGIDDALVKVSSAEEIVEMNNGCICCTVRGDLVRIIHKLLQRKDSLDLILIETTGLADPAPVAQTFFVDDIIAENCRLDAILTIIDSKHVLFHLDEKKEEGVENECVEQIAFADRILINKIDLVSDQEKDKVLQRIRSINAVADILEASYSRFDLDRILGIKAFNLSKVLEMEPDFLNTEGEHQHDATVTSVGIEAVGDCDFLMLNEWLTTLLMEKGNDIFRSKGVISIKGSPHRHIFQGVHMMVQFGSSADGVGRDWDDDEDRVNRLVFIGKNLDRDALNFSFRECLC